MTPLDPTEQKKLREEVERTVKHIDEYFLKDSPFIGGKDISIADLLGICELAQLEIVGEDAIVRKNAKVSAWYDKVKARVQPFYDEATEKLKGLKIMFGEAGVKK